MNPRIHRVLGGLALGLVAGVLQAAAPLPVHQLQALKAQEPVRAAQALGKAQAMLAERGFRAGESLAVRTVTTSPEGRTVVRFDQTFGGYRVYGHAGIAHVEADGRTRLLSEGLRSEAIPSGLPRLTAEEAATRALKHLRLRGKPLPPKVEQVIFPSELTGGLKVTYDRAQGRLVTDREFSVLATPPEDPYVWAYAVDVAAWNPEDGVKDVHLVIDANTGAILRKLTNLHAQAAPGVPAKGLGKSQYSGDVPLDTRQSADGTFALQDMTRGSKPNPYFLRYENTNLTGITTMWESHEGGDPMDHSKWGLNYIYEGNASNTWGDGQPFKDYPNEGLVNGQTAGVDAHYGLGVTWDMYKNVFGRDGIDGKGTTPFAQVHIRDQYSARKFDNAYWSGSLFGMFFGDGSFTADTALKDAAGNPLPGNPNGFMSLTELDITAHELSHGLTDYTARFSYSEESGGLNESSSDIFGALAEAYAARPAGVDDRIPDTGTDWLMGAKVSPSGALRNMKKPSSDGVSADNWYEGLRWLDVHYNSGPMNRAFYFLSQGAAAAANAESHSVYLPGGMSGIGNDKAGRIWFKALSEYMTYNETYHQAAGHLVEAASDLYGAASAEVKAVKQAMTAINVQVAGEPLLTRVTFPVIHTDGWAGQNPGSPMSRMQILPMGTTVKLHAEVKNHPDPSLTWKVGAHLGADYPLADTAGDGVVNPDDTWTAPMRKGWYVMTAISKADPRQYAEGLVNLMNLDSDDDTEQDAVDMGSCALSYYLEYALKPSHSPYGGPWVEDMDAAFFQIAIRSAWGKK